MSAKKTQNAFALVYGSPNPIARLGDGRTISPLPKTLQGIAPRHSLKPRSPQTHSPGRVAWIAAFSNDMGGWGNAQGALRVLSQNAARSRANTVPVAREQAPAPQVAFRALCFFTEQREGWPALTATFDLRTTCAAPLHPACCASTPRPLPACPPGTGCPRSAPGASRCVLTHSF